MEHYYLFLIIKYWIYISRVWGFFKDSTENITHHMLMGNLIFSCKDTLRLLQNASYLDPIWSVLCTLQSVSRGSIRLHSQLGL